MNESYLGTSQAPLTPVTDSERTLAILSHILTIVAWILAPLIIYLVKKDESQFVRAHAKESLNFQLTILLAYIVAGILTLILIGFLLLFVVAALQLVFVIIATIRAADNQLYRYPFTIRFIS